MIALAVNDNLAEAPNDAPETDAASPPPGHERDAKVEHVVSTAVLVATAFRLRDEDGLLRTLRQLAEAVDALEDKVA